MKNNKIYHNRIHRFYQEFNNITLWLVQKRYIDEELIDTMYLEEDANRVFNLSTEQAIMKWAGLVETYKKQGLMVGTFELIERTFKVEC